MDIIEIGSGRESVSYIFGGIGSAGCNMVRGRGNALAISTGTGDLSGFSRRFHIDRSLLPAMEYAHKGIKSSGLANMEKQLIPELYGDVFVGFAGLGGRTTSIVSPYILDIARRQVIPSLFSVTLPFSVESAERVRNARETLHSVMDASNLTLIYRNDHLSEIARDMPIMKSFDLMNSIIWLPIEDISAVMTREDLDVFFKEVSGRAGFFGMGTGSGREKERRAVSEALRGPWIRDALQLRPEVAMAIVRSASPETLDMRDISREIEDKTTVKTLLVGTLLDEKLDPGKAKVSLILMK